MKTTMKRTFTMKRYFSLLAIPLLGCTVGQGQVDLSETGTVTFRGLSALVGDSVATDPQGMRDANALSDSPVTTDSTVSLNVKADLASIGDIGKLTAEISNSSLSGPSLATISHIKATLETEDGTMPEQVVTDIDVPAQSTEVSFPFMISDSQVLAYFAEGSVVLHFYLTGVLPKEPFTLSYDLVAHVSIDVNASISML
jgi:hypothetical protein